MYINKLTYCLLLLLIAAISFSQPSSRMEILKPGQLKKMAESALRQGDLYSAIDYYEKYIQKKPDDIDITHKLAELYYRSRDYAKAEDYFNKAYKGNETKYALDLYFYALMLKMNQKYDEAIEFFNIFKKKYRGRDKYKKGIKSQIYGCNLAKSMLNTPVKTDIVHLNESINKAHIECSPLFKDDNTLIYASLVADSIEYFDPDNTPVRKFYVAERNEETWQHKGVLQGPFNNDNINSENGVYSTDGSKFYFTRCEKNQQNKIICSIWVSEKDSAGWREPQKLNKDINMANYTSTQPAIGMHPTKNIEILYFVTDRPGGKGDMDIWYSLFDEKSGSFKNCKNAGTKINTEFNEMAPFCDNTTRTMYFSSEGFPGMGGLDIFKTTGAQRRWSKPINIGYPLNSSVDDLYYIINTNKKQEGFLVSNRKGGVALKNPTCCFDLYYFELTEFKQLAITGTVFEIKEDKDSVTEEYITNNLLDKAIVNLFYLDMENEEKILMQTDTTNEKGEYNFVVEKGMEYRIEINKNKYFGKNTGVSGNRYDIDTANVKPIGLLLIPKTPIVLENIYYEYGKAELTQTSKETIDSTLLIILKDSPNIIVELSSHTDSVSSEQFNLRLSQRRAESVVNYLIEKGIDKSRLTPKGYGESNPIAPNSNPDGTDNPEGRALNRRTEFKVIGTSDQYSIIDKEEIIEDKEEKNKKDEKTEKKKEKKTKK